MTLTAANAQIRSALAQSKRICIVKPDALGDFLLALPALCAMRGCYPDSHITLLTNPSVYPLATCFDVADVLLPVPLFAKQGVSAQDVQMAAQSVLTLCGGGFDTTVLLRWDIDYYAAAALVFAMNSPQRITYGAQCSAQKLARTPAFDSFFTHVIDDQKVEHEALKNAALLGMDPPAPYWQSAAATLRSGPAVQARLATEFTVGGPYIAVGISASMARKKLSLARWKAILEALAKRFPVPLVVLGGPEDNGFAEQLCAASGALNYCGRLGFAATFMALRNAEGIVAVDSFAKHAAALAGVPVVELSCQSALGDPAAEYGGVRFGAWGVASWLIKPPFPADDCPVHGCLHSDSHCINGIDPLAVVSACVELFGPGGNQGAVPFQAISE
jgi:ADP-heptose:LPS heptosyltransferase